ncbi:MAG: hypothetical protein JWN52_2652 [Actinomycetia bacterium]|nr:hypothetical protein [Actinomycetes bacterium]
MACWACSPPEPFPGKSDDGTEAERGEHVGDAEYPA